MPVVLAYGTEKQAYFNLFVESCQRFGIKPVLLGWGDPWKGTYAKLLSIRDYVRNLAGDQVVISVDPFDVIFLSGLEEIESKFRTMNIPFLCGALNLQHFNARVYHCEFNRTGMPTPEKPTGYQYLNAGTWISTASYACRLLTALTEEGSMGPYDMDQEVFTAQYLRDPSVIDIDWQCRLFHNLLFTHFITRIPQLEDVEFRNGRIWNNRCKTWPCILHASGNTYMGGIAEFLGYSKKAAIPERDVRNYSRKAAFHFWKLLKTLLFSFRQRAKLPVRLFSPVSGRAR